MIKPMLCVAALALCLAGCEPNNDLYSADGSHAWVPVYAQLSHVNHIAVGSAQPTERAGKIYAYGHYIFQNDINKGIHVIDNSDKAHPQKVAFIEIPYNTEFAVRGNYIYANNINDLVVIDIHNVLQPQVVKRMENGFPYINQLYPPGTGYFVCPDPKKGIVIDWKLEPVSSATCRR
jgi:hypothetical protein